MEELIHMKIHEFGTQGHFKSLAKQSNSVSINIKVIYICVMYVFVILYIISYITPQISMAQFNSIGLL